MDAGGLVTATAEAIGRSELPGEQAITAESQGDGRLMWQLFRFVERGLLVACCCVGLVYATVAEVQAQDGEGNRGNLLGDFFRGLNRNIRDTAEELERAKQGRDQIDARIPQNQDFTRRLEQAQNFLQGKRWHEALEILQYLQAQTQDAFLFDQQQRLQSLHSRIRELFAELPEEALRNYQNRYGATASQLAQQAQQEQDLAGLFNTASLHFQTPAGKAAALQAAVLLRDQGEPSAAARSLTELARVAESPAARQRLATLAIRCAQLAHDRHQVEQLQREFRLSPLSDPAFLPQREPIQTGQLATTQLLSISQNVPADAVPRLIPNWTQVLLDRPLAEEQIRQLAADLKESGRAILPSGQVVISGEKLAYRTLRGLEVREVSSGRLLWESRSLRELESRLSSSRDQEQLSMRYSGRAPEYHPVTSLLYRDGITASLTTDGEHLFAIEGHEPISETSRGSVWQRRASPDPKDAERWNTNEIVAYDFATGRVRWRLGGKPLEEPFTRPLAGTFFFGPPVADGGELFAIGERDGIVSLYVIAARTGEVEWSQEISLSSRGVDVDQVRRFWPCMPAIREGIIVCPTTGGWLVAVDRYTQKLLWASRYSPRQTRNQRSRGGFAAQTVEDLNRRWAVTPPLIVDRHVLFTPPELPNEFGVKEVSSFCFDLQTGEELWRQEKGDGLFLSGVAEGQAIFIGSSSIIARNIADGGKQTWKLALDSQEGKPSGRGVILNQHLLVPVDQSVLLTVDLRTGGVASRERLHSRHVELGHLTYHRGQLLSLSNFELSAFPIWSAESDATQLALGSFTSHFVATERLLADGQLEQALDAIEQFRSHPSFQSLSPVQREQLRSMEWNTLVKLTQQNPEETSELLLTLQTLAETPQEQTDYKRLAADRERSLGNFRSALGLYFSLFDPVHQGMSIQEGTRTVSVDAWVAGRVWDLIEETPVTERQGLNAELERHVLDLAQSRGLHERLARAFLRLPAGQQLEYALARSAADAGELTEALVRYQRIATLGAPNLQVQAELRLSELLVKLGAVADVRRSLARVLQLPDVTDLQDFMEEEQSSHALAHSRLARLPEDDILPETTNWGRFWEAARTGNQGREFNVELVEGDGDTYEFLSNFRFLFQNQQQRLRIEDATTGRYVWSTPLRSMTNIAQRSNVGLLQSGAMTYAVHRGALHALQIPNKQVRWTYVPPVTGMAVSRLRSPSQSGTTMMNHLGAFRNGANLISFRTPYGILLGANPFAVLVLDEELRALDPLTGELLWSERDFDRRLRAELLDDRMLLCIRENPRFIRLLDGAAEGPRVDQLFLTECLMLAPNQVVRLSLPDGKKQWSLRSGTLENPAKHWELTLEAETLLGSLSEQQLLAISPQAELSLISLDTGERHPVGAIPGDLMEVQKRIYYFEDESLLFIAVAHGEARTSYVSLPSLRAAGTILAYSKSGGLLWSQSTEALGELLEAQAQQKPGQDENAQGAPQEQAEAEPAQQQKWSMNLITKELNRSPLLLFISDRPEHREKIYFRRLTLTGLDKQTGERVFDWHRISNSGGFSYLHLDLQERSFDLRTYNERLKIRAVPDPLEAAPGDNE